MADFAELQAPSVGTSAWSSAAAGWARNSVSLLPGLLLVFAIAALSYALRLVPGVANFSTLIIAIALGTAFHNLVGTPDRCRLGITFSLKRLLRIAVALLGLQLTIAQVITVGGPGMLIVVVTLGSTFLFTTWLGARIGVSSKLTQLIAAGTSICGASAVIATNTVTKADDEDVAYAVACVTVFGTLSMFLLPMLPGYLHLQPHAFGLWAGASIHEIAQVVAAAFQNGSASGDFGTIAKLSRVAMLAPVVLTLSFLASSRSRSRSPAAAAASGRVPVPWFVVGFLVLMGFNSFGLISAQAKTWIVILTTALLTVALTAMGLETDFRKLRAKGLKPLLLGAGAWIFISAFSLVLVELVY
ncbi:MAG TPA: YeiH family protein [Xanthobacteraceae bacterium]